MIPAPVAAAKGYAEREMTDRAVVERDAGGAGDPYGGEAQSWQPHLADQPCKAWVETGRTAVTEDRTAVVADWSMAVPVGTDIAVGDRVTSVTARSGDTIIGRTMYVDYVEHKRVQLVCKLERRG